ncbi:glycine--tRNA ligase subunit beta [Helicobacter sp. 12S02634-8]|uniref:glycine--tRNA ligase subunit beta n=1 Tax=Helicobacter sp. 12S02634-8 TaxID=1476199 RepID=UPI000BA7CA23|nr:glycine--tRNA ligase subunit beta [Helicobacter sp. 12S02634-8]PAF46664.1 glycine--tRNA ligase subunit beta [Helicobacter sp. 12S02634-8]
MNTEKLLIEILVEELPAKPFLKEFGNIADKWRAALRPYNLSSEPEIFFTPRRIVVFDRAFPLTTAAHEEELFGPPVSIAYVGGDPKNPLSKAGESFCKKCGIEARELAHTTKEGKEVLYFSKHIAGVHTDTFLPSVVMGFLESLHFGKSMRWGSVKESFIRPIRNICILFGKQDILMQAYGFQAQRATKIHPDKSFEWQKVASVSEYFDTLKQGCVILSQEERRAMILSQIQAIEQNKGICVEIDSGLLEEIIAITEYPRALYGEFDAEFLALPEEVIITSMRENQRYFALKKGNALHNGFVVVSNSTALDTQKIVLGNQKVLKARLADAMFFYRNDLKSPLNSDRLCEVRFVEGLGSLADKVMREKKIALFLLEKYKNILPIPLSKVQDMMVHTLDIAKADLLSEMVYEFPELQGLMGYYYAKAQGEAPSIALALKEQYLPTGEDSPLPSELFGGIVALVGKLDSIFALFSIGKSPTGSKDPFGLRRAAAGVLKIILHYQLPLRLDTDLKSVFESVGYASFDLGLLEEFFLERLLGIVGLNPSLYRSVLGAGERDVCQIVCKSFALNQFFENSNKEAFISTFKRLANITKDIQTLQPISPSLFKQPEEIQLYEAYSAIKQREFASIDTQIQTLFALKDPLDIFFQNVLVNDADTAIRENRKNLIFGIYQEFLQIGDIKEIAF